MDCNRVTCPHNHLSFTQTMVVLQLLFENLTEMIRFIPLKRPHGYRNVYMSVFVCMCVPLHISDMNFNECKTNKNNNHDLLVLHFIFRHVLYLHIFHMWIFPMYCMSVNFTHNISLTLCHYVKFQAMKC